MRINRKYSLTIGLSLFAALLCNNIFAQDKPNASETIINTGNIQIHLPKLSGFTECLNDKNTKEHVESRTLSENLNLALYITDQDYLNIDDIEFKHLSNYLLVFTTKELENVDINSYFINALDSIIISNYGVNTWNLAKSQIENKVKNLKIDEPVLLEHFMIDSETPCIITLTRALYSNREKIYLTATSLNSINNRFISFAWYKLYEGEESIAELKSEISYFTMVSKQMNKLSRPIQSTEKRALEDAVSHYNNAYKLSNENKFSLAVEEYSKAILLYPEYELQKISEAYYNRGLNKRQLNDLEGAINDYTAAISYRADYYKAYHNRGFAKIKIGYYKEAISDFSYIIDSKISDTKTLASAYGNRGIAKVALGENGCDDFKIASQMGAKEFDKYKTDCD